MDIKVILFSMIQLFLVMAVGYVLYKIKILDADFNKKLTKLLLNVTLPALIISSVMGSGQIKQATPVWFVFLMAVIIYAVFPVIGFIVVKLLRIKKNEQGLYMFMIAFSNVAFMGIPVMNAIYGPESIFYLTIYNMLFNLCLYLYGSALMSYGTGVKTKFNIKQLINPGIISGMIALVIYFLNIQVHSVIVDSLSMIGGLTTPIAMMIIGSTLAKLPFKDIFNEWHIYPFTIVKQIIIPVIAYPILKLVISDPLLLGVTLIMIAMPVANSAVLFATEYNGDEALAAKTVCITTLLSIITIPVIVALFLA